MTQRIETDVVVVGAGTSGTYFAWRLAQVGFKTVVLEKRHLDELGANIGIFHMDEIRFAQFGIPLPTGDELIDYYPDGRAWPPDGDDFKLVKYAFYVMEKPLFIQRLHRYAALAGVRFIEQATVGDIIVENGALVGLRATTNDGPLEVRARLVADCSGIGGAVRTRLPDGFGVENDPISDDDTLFVILQYWDDIEGKRPTGLNFYPFHKTFCNPSYGDGAILGIGQPGGYEHTDQVQHHYVLDQAVLGQQREDRARHEQRGEQAANDAPAQRQTEPFDLLAADIVDNHTDQQRGDVGVDDGAERLVEGRPDVDGGFVVNNYRAIIVRCGQANAHGVDGGFEHRRANVDF